MTWADVRWELAPIKPIVTKEQEYEQFKPAEPEKPVEKTIQVQTVDFEKMTNFANNENTGQQRDDNRSEREKVERPTKDVGKKPAPKTRNRKTTTKKGGSNSPKVAKKA